MVGAGPFRIVGVIADIHQAPLGQPDEPVIYHTIRQFPYRPMTLVARGTDRDGCREGDAHGAAARSIRSLPLSNVQTLGRRLLRRRRRRGC